LERSRSLALDELQANPEQMAFLPAADPFLSFCADDTVADFSG
jgi:hypothetical protein